VISPHFCSTALDSWHPTYHSKLTLTRLVSKQAAAAASQEISLQLAAAAAAIEQKNLQRVGWKAKFCSERRPHSKLAIQANIYTVRTLNLKFRLHRQKKFHTSGQKVFFYTCAVEKNTFSEFINLLYDYRDIFFLF